MLVSVDQTNEAPEGSQLFTGYNYNTQEWYFKGKPDTRTLEELKASMPMNVYKIKYENGTVKVVTAKTTIEVIKKYDLATRENINTVISQLEGEQKAIALSNYE